MPPIISFTLEVLAGHLGCKITVDLLLPRMKLALQRVPKLLSQRGLSKSLSLDLSLLHFRKETAKLMVHRFDRLALISGAGFFH